MTDWKPIGSAPIGEPILVFCPDAREPHVCIAMLSEFVDAANPEITFTDWTDFWAETNLDVEPVLWAPMPQLPILWRKAHLP